MVLGRSQAPVLAPRSTGVTVDVLGRRRKSVSVDVMGDGPRVGKSVAVRNCDGRIRAAMAWIPAPYLSPAIFCGARFARGGVYSHRPRVYRTTVGASPTGSSCAARYVRRERG